MLIIEKYIYTIFFLKEKRKEEVGGNYNKVIGMPMSRAGQDKSSCCDGLAAWALGREWSSGPALVPVGPDDRTHVKFGRRGRGGGGGCWQVHLSASWRPLDGSDLQRGDPWGVRKRASLSSETAVKTTTPSLPNGSSGRELAGQSPRRSE